MSIYLSLILYKESFRIPSPSCFLLKSSWNVSNNEFHYKSFIKHVFSDNDIEHLMITANLILGEVIWLLFELFLNVIKIRTDKTNVTYIEVANINLHFKCRFIRAFFYIMKPAESPTHPAAC